MGIPLPGIGVIFDIDELGKLGLGSYGYKARHTFMKHVDPAKLAGCVIMHGDTNSTLYGASREFCIAVYGINLDVEYIKKVFGELESQGLSPQNRRFIEKPQLDSEPLPEYGKINALGALMKDSWDIEDHELCKEVGWQYKPQTIPSNLSAHLKNELADLAGNKTSKVERQPSTSLSLSYKKWWQFWK